MFDNITPSFINTHSCLYCHDTETIEHIYIECENTIEVWQYTEHGVRPLHSPHFKISDIKKIFGGKQTDHIKHIIIISIKDVIYQKRKNGDKMCLSDGKRALFKKI